MTNLLKRSITGTLFCAIIIASLTFVPSMFPPLMIVSLYMCMNEFYNISLGNSFRFEARLSIFAACILFAVVYAVRLCGCDTKWLCIAAIPVSISMIRLLFVKDVQDLYHKVPFLFMGLIYIGVPCAFAPFLTVRGGEFDGILMLSFFIIIWVSDIGAYCVGSVLGQRPGAKKLAPNISPKKSWWGVAGGVVLSIVAALVLYFVKFLDMPLVHALVVGLILCIGGICGDLFESLFKRAFHVKDSGNAIPGHGGFLDRFDSSLMAMPLATIYLALFNIL